jgi:hypothetical protein
MGDGLLAIFAITVDETAACKRALAAARQAQTQYRCAPGAALCVANGLPSSRGL